MKTSLPHLTPENQSEILQIAEVIKEVIKPEKIILFGSYAKGDQVDDTYFENGVRYQYISDYDFLVIPKDNSSKEYVIQDKIVNRFRHLRIPVNIIVHDIKYVNEGLAEAQYFFTDVIKEGILLFDSGTAHLQTARELTPAEQKVISQRYFDQWYATGTDFLDAVSFYLQRGKLKLSAFMLHQAAENFYNTILLVFTGYKPKTHNLDKLRQYAKHISEELFAIFPFPTENDEEKHLFDILKRGYIDARYKEDFTPTSGDIEKLLVKLMQIKQVVKELCEKRLVDPYS